MFFTLAACKSKIYHNTTARFNGYYNATERLKQAQQTLERSNVDNYDKILSVFQFGDEAKSKAVQPDMDEIFKKAGIIIQKHGKSKWVDNCYLLVAKSHFYKRDFYSAIEVFQYINDSYKNTQESYEATIWIMICKLMLNKNDEAFSVSSSLKSDLELLNIENKALFNASMAEYYIRQQEYVQAQKYIFRTLKFAEGKTYRTRLKFILAQLYQRNGKTTQAINYYTSVIKSNPPYEMSFNSKLNIGRSYDPAKPETIKQSKNKLHSMAKDDKNLSYLDKIYFELGVIAQLENKPDLAISNYKLALFNYKDQNTKALTFLQMADLYFKLANYPLAQAYYDSTGMFLSTKYDGYEKLNERKKVLSEIIKNLLIIQAEDSLQRLGKLSDDERKKIIEKYKTEAQQLGKKKDRNKREDPQNGDNNYISPNANTNNNYQQGQGDEWYFYNPTAIGIGFNEFNKRWGNRNNEDFWFILDLKTSRNTENQDPNSRVKNETSNPTDSGRVKTVVDRMPKTGNTNATLKIPITAEDVIASNNRIIDAYVANGLIFKDKLNDPKEAIKIFETLLQLYPENPHLAKVYYYLFKCYDELKNTMEAAKYRDLVLSKFENSDYANIIKSTGKNSTATGSNEEALYYEATYEKYKMSSYEEVKQRCAEAQTRFGGSNLMGKFDYLRALAIGKTESEAKFKEALEYVVKTYPNTDVYVASNTILDYLKRKNAPPQEASSTAKYSYAPTNEHYYMLLTDDVKANVEALKANYSDYNAEYHRLESFSINTYILGDKTKIIVIKPFDNSAKAFDYYRELINNTLFFDKVGVEEYSQCVISDENFKILMKKMEEEEYLNFFLENYK